MELDHRVGFAPEIRDCIVMVSKSLHTETQIGCAQILKAALDFYTKTHPQSDVRDPRFAEAVYLIKANYVTLIVGRGAKNRLRILCTKGEK